MKRSRALRTRAGYDQDREAMTFDLLPAKASATGIGRRVVYLDQNVLTELTKLRLGRLREGARKPALTTLAASLRSAVFERQDARCIESFFHHWESSGLVLGETTHAGAEELFREMWDFLATHSWGLKFHTPHHATEFQALVTVAASTGRRKYPRALLWRGAFAKDPSESNEEGGVRVGGTLFLIGVRWEPRTMLNPGWAERVQVPRAAGRYANFDRSHAELCKGLREGDGEDDRRYSWAHRWGDRDDPMDAEAVTEFIASDAYGALPTNDVLTRVGARVPSEPTRKLADSDFGDMRIRGRGTNPVAGRTATGPACRLTGAPPSLRTTRHRPRHSQGVRAGRTVRRPCDDTPADVGVSAERIWRGELVGQPSKACARRGRGTSTTIPSGHPDHGFRASAGC